MCELYKEDTIYFENDITHTYISLFFFSFKKSDPGMWVLNTLHTRKQANRQTKHYSRFKFSPSSLFPSSSSFFSPSSYPLPFYLAFFCLEFTLSLFPLALGFSITPNTEPSFCISLLCSSILFIRCLPSASVQLHGSPRFLPDALLWFRGSIQNTKDNNSLVFPWAGIQVFIFSFTNRLVHFFFNFFSSR